MPKIAIPIRSRILPLRNYSFYTSDTLSMTKTFQR